MCTGISCTWHIQSIQSCLKLIVCYIWLRIINFKCTLEFFDAKPRHIASPPYLSLTCIMTARERHNIAWTFWAIVVVFNTRKTRAFGSVEGFLRVYLWANCKTTQSGILKLSFFKWKKINCTRWGRTIAKHPRTTHN